MWVKKKGLRHHFQSIFGAHYLKNKNKIKTLLLLLLIVVKLISTLNNGNRGCKVKKMYFRRLDSFDLWDNF